MKFNSGLIAGDIVMNDANSNEVDSEIKTRIEELRDQAKNYRLKVATETSEERQRADLFDRVVSALNTIHKNDLIKFKDYGYKLDIQEHPNGDSTKSAHIVRFVRQDGTFNKIADEYDYLVINEDGIFKSMVNSKEVVLNSDRMKDVCKWLEVEPREYYRKKFRKMLGQEEVSLDKRTAMLTYDYDLIEALDNHLDLLEMYEPLIDFHTKKAVRSGTKINLDPYFKLINNRPNVARNEAILGTFLEHPELIKAYTEKYLVKESEIVNGCVMQEPGRTRLLSRLVDIDSETKPGDFIIENIEIYANLKKKLGDAEYKEIVIPDLGILQVQFLTSSGGELGFTIKPFPDEARKVVDFVIFDFKLSSNGLVKSEDPTNIGYLYTERYGVNERFIVDTLKKYDWDNPEIGSQLSKYKVDGGKSGLMEYAVK